MFRAVNDYLAKINIVTDSVIRDAAAGFLEKSESVDSFTINESVNRYIVDIRMVKYSVDLADKLFREFISAVAYPYSHISVRYNEEARVRYRFASCKEDKTGTYMDVIIQ